MLIAGALGSACGSDDAAPAATGGSGGSGAREGGASGGSSGSGGTGASLGSGGSRDASPDTPVEDGIYEIQEIRDGSVFVGVEVRVQKVFVTAAKRTPSGAVNLVVQEPQGETKNGHPYPEYAGVSVFMAPEDGGPEPMLAAIGDCVDVTGSLSEFQNKTQIERAEVTPATGCGTAPMPFAITATKFAAIASDTNPNQEGDQAGPDAEPFESVLLRLDAVRALTAPLAQGGLFQVALQSKPTGEAIWVDDFYFRVPATPNQNYASFTGVFSQGANYVLLPRSAADAVTQ